MSAQQTCPMVSGAIIGHEGCVYGGRGALASGRRAVDVQLPGALRVWGHLRGRDSVDRRCGEGGVAVLGSQDVVGVGRGAATEQFARSRGQCAVGREGQGTARRDPA